MIIDNSGAVDDELVRASSAAATRMQMQIHAMAMDGNVMRMRDCSAGT